MAQKETIMNPSFNSPVTSNSRFKVLPVILFVLLILALGAAGYFYYQNMQLQKNPQIAAQEELKQTVDKVSHLIVLPKGETPTIATVTDPKLLKDQPFFANAQVGDKVLIYTTAKKAILYRPSANIIIDVAPINIGNTPTTPTTPTPAPTPNK